MSLRVLYVDLNSYFASVEQQLRPELRGKPVGVLPVLADTTCCIAASINAKRYGIKTGTPVWQARKLCPKVIFVAGAAVGLCRVSSPHRRGGRVVHAGRRGTVDRRNELRSDGQRTAGRKRPSRSAIASSRRFTTRSAKFYIARSASRRTAFWPRPRRTCKSPTA
jgi:Nucleotidyltransferase/DNA polymerase involved in DNA repair